MRRILIVGGGYAGFYAAWKLEKKLRSGDAEVTLVDRRPYMTYQPFLPEVVAGSIEARHAAVSHRRHLSRTRLVAGMVTAIDHAHRVVTVGHADGHSFELGYDVIVVTAGAVTGSSPYPVSPSRRSDSRTSKRPLRSGTGCSPRSTWPPGWRPGRAAGSCSVSLSSAADSQESRASANCCHSRPRC